MLWLSHDWMTHANSAQIAYIDIMYKALSELDPSGNQPNASIFGAASRLACIQTKSTYEYSECTEFGKNMCSCERELDSMTLEPCAMLPTGRDLRKLREGFILMDAECMQIMHANLNGTDQGQL